MSAYRIAIDRTAATINRRATYYRNLIVAIVAIGVGSLGWVIATRAWWPLAGLALVVPACGVFFFFDAKLLQDWQVLLMRAWVRKDLDFHGFLPAVNAIPTLPKDTLRGMLARLPVTRDLVEEQGMSSSTREAVALAVAAIHERQSMVLAIKAAAAFVVSASIVVTAALRVWDPLLADLLLIVVPPLRSWLTRKRADTLKERISIARAKPDFNEARYVEVVVAL